jgi:succinate dehydrogenase / fumarate reductase iron-sulfur subunit
MNLTLKIWRQKNAATPGRFETLEAHDVSPDMSFLEMLDMVNERLIAAGQEPFVFDSDCREGICGTSSTASPTAATKAPPSASFTCAIFRTARTSPSNRGARGRFRR